MKVILHLQLQLLSIVMCVISDLSLPQSLGHCNYCKYMLVVRQLYFECVTVG